MGEMEGKFFEGIFKNLELFVQPQDGSKKLDLAVTIPLAYKLPPGLSVSGLTAVVFLVGCSLFVSACELYVMIDCLLKIMYWPLIKWIKLLTLSVTWASLIVAYNNAQIAKLTAEVGSKFQQSTPVVPDFNDLSKVEQDKIFEDLVNAFQNPEKPKQQLTAELTTFPEHYLGVAIVGIILCTIDIIWLCLYSIWFGDYAKYIKKITSLPYKLVQVNVYLAVIGFIGIFISFILVTIPATRPLYKLCASSCFFSLVSYFFDIICSFFYNR